jgi:hypothetical protein
VTNNLCLSQQLHANGDWNSPVALEVNAVLLAAAQNNDGRLEVLYTNSNTQIMHCYQNPNGTWTGGQNFFGATAQQVTLTREKLGRFSTLPILALLLATLAGHWQPAQAAGAATSAPTSATSAAAAAAKAQALLQAQLAWQKSMAQKPQAASGCFKALYPATKWQSVPCVTAPPGPQGGRILHPEIVGSGADYAATVTGTATSMNGSFDAVEGAKQITGGKGSDSNFALQLNTELFSTPACSSAPTAAACKGWEQFIYSNSGKVFIQFWKINYSNNSNCPKSWTYSKAGSGCYFNSPAAPVPVQSVGNLAQLSLTAVAASGGNDSVTISTSPTSIYSVGYADNVLSLASAWNGAEFNIVGDANGSATSFNPGVSIGIRLAANSTSGAAPTCAQATVLQWVTTETNNLNLANDCTTVGNAIHYTEANTPIITTITPAYGPATGGTPVVLTGSGFTNATKVTFLASDGAPTPVPYAIISDSQIDTTSPACSTLGCGQATFGELVTVTGPTGSGGAPVGFKPYAFVNGVSPANGTAGTVVTVVGNGFYNYAPSQSFLFNGVQAQDVNCGTNRNTQCTMNAPPGVSGTVDVQYSGTANTPATTDGRSPVNGKDKFSYGSGPTIVSINPTHGPQAGGTQITLNGTGFTQTMEAGFNGFYVGIDGDCPTSTQCVFQTPRGQGQEYITVLDYKDGLSSTAGSGSLFTYDAPPPSGTLRPTGGPAAGGTAVEADLTSVSSSANIALQFHFSSGVAPVSGAVCKTSVGNAADSYCDFTSPPLPAGINPPVAVPVSVTEAGNILQLGNFTYEAPSPGSVSPDIGSPTGGTHVTVHVNNLAAGAGAVVDFTFNGTPAAAPNAACTVDAGDTGNSTCTATTPPLPADEIAPIQIPVSVMAQGKTVTVGNFQYGSKPPPSQCAICVEGGGVCSIENGKFVCTCHKSSPTGACQ